MKRLDIENLEKCPTCATDIIKESGRIYCKDFPVRCNFSIKGPAIEFEHDSFTYAVFDLETTGVGKTESITQYAVRKFSSVSGELMGKSDSLVKTHKNKSVPMNIQELTGITNEMLRTAPTIDEAMQLLLDTLLSGDGKMPDYIVAHNAAFDFRFLSLTLTRCETVSFPIPPFVDTLKMARDVIPKSEIENHKQETIAAKLGISYDFEEGTHGAHSADADVYVLSKIFEYLITRIDHHEGIENYVIKANKK